MEQKKVGFVLQAIKTEQFAILVENLSNKKPLELGSQLQFKFDQKQNLIGVEIGFEYIQSKKVLLKIVVSCHFKIEVDSWQSFLIIQEGKLVVPKGFLAHLAMITVGTARGVLHAKTESTDFSKFIIPAINVIEMIPDDAVIDMVVN
jgi:hypothetical protein